MMSWLRKHLVSLRNRLYHPGVAADLGTSLSPKAQLERGVTVGRDCTVLKARLVGRCLLEDRVLVSDNVEIYTSELGADCRVEAGVHISSAHFESSVAVHQDAELCAVKIGRFSYVARETIVNDVEIGRFCSIGPRCLIGSGDHPVNWLATSPAFYSSRHQAGRSLAGDAHIDADFAERRRITIGHDVWIGAHVFVRDGVRIGNGAIVAAGAVVIDDIPAFAVTGGVPARTIRSRFSPEVIKQLESIRWWDWSEERLRQARPIIASVDVQALLEFARSRSGPG